MGHGETRNEPLRYWVIVTVEPSVQSRFRLLQFTALLGFAVIDGPCRHVAVNGKLLSGHSVKRKARADLGHPRCPFGDYHEIHDQKNAEDHQAQKDASAHDELGKPVDHVTRRICTCVTLTDDQFGRRYVERESKHQ